MRQLALLFLISVTLPVSAEAQVLLSAQTLQEMPLKTHAEAVALSKEGKHLEALGVLEYLVRKNSKNNVLLYDYIDIANQAEEYSRAEEKFALTNEKIVPAFVLESMARAYYRTNNLAEADRLYSLALSRFPDRLESRIPYIYFLTDTGSLDKALAEASVAVSQASGKIQAWEAKAYVHKARAENGLALLAWQRCLEIDPTYNTAKIGKSHSLQAMGAPLFASAEVLPESDALKLKQDRGARLLRFAVALPVPSADKEKLGREATELALTSLDSEQDEDRRSSRLWDIVLGMVERREYERAIYTYKHTTVVLGKEAPDYAKRSVAEAYMSINRPWEAEPLLREVLANNPKSFDTRQALFYCLVELEEHDEATKEVDLLVKMTPLQAYSDHPKISKLNPEYSQAVLMQAMQKAYSGKPEEAEEAVEVLREKVGGNSSIAVAQAQLWLWRGKPREAKALLLELLAEDPYNDEARRVLSDVYHEIGETAKYEETYSVLATRYYGLPSSHVHDTKHEARNAADISGSVSWGRGGSDGGDDLTIDTKYRTQQVNGLRWYARLRHGSQREYSYSEEYLGAGFEKRYRDSTASVELGTGRGSNPSLAVNYLRYLGDAFSASGYAELNSPNLSYKGYAFGVTGDRYGGTVNYHPNEGFKTTVSYGLATMNDGNHRTEVGLSVTKLMYSDHKKLIWGSVYTANSDNSKPDQAYFSPETSNATGATLTLDYTEKKFRDSRDGHLVSLDFGNFAQKNYSTLGYASLKYERVFKFSLFAEGAVGVSRGYHPWDGKNEWNTGIYFTWNYKFR